VWLLICVKMLLIIRLITWTSVPCVFVFIRKGTTGGSAFTIYPTTLPLSHCFTKSFTVSFTVCFIVCFTKSFIIYICVLIFMSMLFTIYRIQFIKGIIMYRNHLFRNLSFDNLSIIVPGWVWTINNLFNCFCHQT